MKLSLYTLASELDGIIANTSLHIDCNNPKLDYPILFSAGDHRYFDNILYVAESGQLVESRDRIERYLKRNPSLTFSCICIGEAPSFCLEAANCDIAQTDSEKNRIEVFNAIQKVFHRFNAWERGLDALVDQGCELADLANASLKIFKNDICITDPFSRVLVHRIYRSNQLSRAKTDLIQEGHYLPMTMVLDGVEDEENERGFASFAPELFTMRAFQCLVLRSAISVLPDYTLILSVHSNFRDVSRGDCAPALALAQAIKRLYTVFETAENSSLHINANTSFKDLVKGKRPVDAELVQCAANLGWNRSTDSYVCLCINFTPNSSGQDDHFMQPFISICNRMQAKFDCVAFVLDGHITAIANLSHAKTCEALFCESVREFAQECQLTVGASEAYAGLDSLHGSYQQAFSALKTCHAHRKIFCRFNDYALEIGMSFILKEMRPEYFCPRTLVDMAQNNPHLYEALRAYLMENCNANAAAKHLDLQRSSFIYRLEKARAALVGNLDDPDERLRFLISVKLIDLYGIDNIAPVAHISLGQKEKMP